MSEFHFITGCINTVLLRLLRSGGFVTLQSECMSNCVTFLHQTCFEVIIRQWLVGASLQLGNMQISAMGTLRCLCKMCGSESSVMIGELVVGKPLTAITATHMQALVCNNYSSSFTVVFLWHVLLYCVLFSACKKNNTGKSNWSGKTLKWQAC